MRAEGGGRKRPDLIPKRRFEEGGGRSNAGELEEG